MPLPVPCVEQPSSALNAQHKDYSQQQQAHLPPGAVGSAAIAKAAATAAGARASGPPHMPVSLAAAAMTVLAAPASATPAFASSANGSAAMPSAPAAPASAAPAPAGKDSAPGAPTALQGTCPDVPSSPPAPPPATPPACAGEALAKARAAAPVSRLMCCACKARKAGWFSVGCRHMGPCTTCVPEDRKHTYTQCLVCSKAVTGLARVFA